jgi:histidine ammonia-lyase
LKSSAILEVAHEYVRSFVSFAKEDRIFADDINKIKSIISDFSFVLKVNELAINNGISLNKAFEGFDF